MFKLIYRPVSLINIFPLALVFKCQIRDGDKLNKLRSCLISSILQCSRISLALEDCSSKNTREMRNGRFSGSILVLAASLCSPRRAFFLGSTSFNILKSEYQKNIPRTLGAPPAHTRSIYSKSLIASHMYRLLHAVKRPSND